MKTQADEYINIEMQLSNQQGMVKRTLFYWSRLFVDQLQKGKGYHTLRPTITINICNFTMLAHSTFHLCEDENKERLKKEEDVLEIHFLEMNKFIEAWYNKQVEPLTDILVRWLLLLGMVDARKQKVYDDIYRELEVLAMEDEKLVEAFQAWENLSQTPETIIAYHSRLKTIIDEEAKIDAAKHYGKMEGKEEGVWQQKVATIKIGLHNNVSLETLALLTNLSLADVEKSYTV